MTTDNKTLADSQHSFTTGHCQHNARPGGCQLHNLQCGWPNCDRKAVEPSLADARPGGRVRLADQALSTTELRRNAHVLVLQELRGRFTDAGSPSRTAALDAAIAALSAQPSPGGQGEAQSIDYEDLLDQAKDLIHCGCSVNGAFDWLLEQLTNEEPLAARQPVGEPVAFIAQCELDSLRSIEGGNHLVTVWAKRTGQAGVPLYDAPWQTVDLTRLTRWTNYGSADEWDDVYEPDPDGEWVKYSDLLTLIDSQAVGK